MYAENTKVPAAQTEAEIKTFVVDGRGADGWAPIWLNDDGQERAEIGFRLDGVFVKIRLPLPSRDERRFHYRRGSYSPLPQAQSEARYQQAIRSLWRGLLLNIKAKFEAVDSGLETFNEAFLAHIVVKDGVGNTMTVGDFMLPQVESAYRDGAPPQPLMLTAGSRADA